MKKGSKKISAVTETTLYKLLYRIRGLKSTKIVKEARSLFQEPGAKSTKVAPVAKNSFFYSISKWIKERVS